MTQPLSVLRRTGIALSATALLLWVVSLYGLLVVASDGVNIGAALQGEAAIVLSVSSLIVLLVSLGRARTPMGRMIGLDSMWQPELAACWESSTSCCGSLSS
jgi:hypothetical protein